MAIYPCDIEGHRYPGPQRTAYPALVNGGNTERRKLRLCKPHFDTTVQLCESFMFDSDAPDIPSCCARCDNEVTHHAAYITLYDQGADRRDLYAPLCEEHAQAWLAVLRMTP